MLTALLQRLVRPVAAPAGVPVAVCPPTLFACTDPMWRRMAYRLRRKPAAPGALDRVAQVQREFADSLRDVHDIDAGLLLERIARARSLLELWHLRPEVFRLVSLHYSQQEALRRLAHLNRHYPTRSPRSGFAPLLD